MQPHGQPQPPASQGMGNLKVSGLHEMLWIAAVASCIKLLMMPSYRSTDFEVHRHWLAITHSLPLKEWYQDETSEWTLDYPPFFAWFEWLLSRFAQHVDPKIVDLTGGLNYAGDSVVIFQRTTVILSDGVLCWGLWSFCNKTLSLRKQRIIYAAVLLSPGLFIVDHMHFQYNGFLMGILLLSLACLRDGRDLEGGVLFAVLVCFKHLFAVAGPVYFVYLLRHYCRGERRILNFFKLGFAVLSVVGVAFAPFVYHGQMGQILKRLFPFGRGLSHAYWAPNLWALYNASDKVLAVIWRRLLGREIHTPVAGLTGGLVGDFTPFAVLPQITPSMTAGLVLLSMVPCLEHIWRKPSKSNVVSWIAYAYTCGFMFGWHVHEKASLHFVIPLSLISLESKEMSGDFLLLSTVSYYSLFPLLFEAQEYPVKVLLLVLYTFGLLTYYSYYWETSISSSTSKDGGGLKLQQSDGSGDSDEGREGILKEQSEGGVSSGDGQQVEILGAYQRVYLWGLVVIEVYGQFLHKFLFGERFSFIPLLLISVYCALGELYAWAKQLTRFMLQ